MTPQDKAKLQVVLRKALAASLDKHVEGWMQILLEKDQNYREIDGTIDLDKVSLDLANAVEEFQS